MNAKIAIALGACFVGAALCAAETNAVAEVARQVEANVVAEAVEEMSPELKAWIAQMDHFIQDAGFKSEVDEKGMFRIRFGFPDERTQCVYVMPGVYEENGYRTIHVRSVAYCGNLTKAMAMQLLTTNYSLGFWQLEPCKKNLGKYEVLFSVQLPADVKPEDFKTVCGIVAERADNREAIWSDDDVY